MTNTIYFSLSSIYRFYKGFESGILIEQNNIPADLFDIERNLYNIIDGRDVGVSLSDTDRVILLDNNFEKVRSNYEFLLKNNFFSTCTFLKLLIRGYDILKAGGDINGTVLLASLCN